MMIKPSKTRFIVNGAHYYFMLNGGFGERGKKTVEGTENADVIKTKGRITGARQ